MSTSHSTIKTNGHPHPHPLKLPSAPRTRFISLVPGLRRRLQGYQMRNPVFPNHANGSNFQLLNSFSPVGKRAPPERASKRRVWCCKNMKTLPQISTICSPRIIGKDVAKPTLDLNCCNPLPHSHSECNIRPLSRFVGEPVIFITMMLYVF